MRHAATTFLALTFLLLAGTPLAAQEEAQDTMTQDTMAEAMPAMEVTEALVATGVQDREPVGADTTFTADVGTVYFYTVFEGDFGETQVEHVWTHEGEEIARVPLTVQGPRWRTWSSKEILPEWTGSWTVTVVDAQGNEHASARFTVGDGM